MPTWLCQCSDGFHDAEAVRGGGDDKGDSEEVLAANGQRVTSALAGKASDGLNKVEAKL